MSKAELSFLSKIAKSNSIQTTIPKEIVDFCGLIMHDVLICSIGKKTNELVKKGMINDE